MLFRVDANSDGEFQLEEVVSLLSRVHGACSEQEGHEEMEAFTAAYQDASGKNAKVGAELLLDWADANSDGGSSSERP